MANSNAGNMGTDGYIELTFTAAGDSTQSTVVQVNSADTGSRTIQVGDISFDLDLEAVWNDAVAGNTAGVLEDADTSSYAGSVVTFTDNSIKNQIEVTQSGTEVTTCFKTLDRDAVATAEAFGYLQLMAEQEHLN